MTQNFGAFNPMIPKVPQITVPNAGPSCNIIWVDEMQNALDHPTAPNEQMYFAEKNSNVIWVRETDGNGSVKNPLRKLVYSVEDVPFGPEANYVTKDEYQKLFDLVSGIGSKVDNLVSQLN